MRFLVATIIVTYNPDKSFFERVKTLSTIANDLIIVDNHSKNIDNFHFKNKNIHVIKLNHNYGIGYAQNVGINYIEKHIDVDGIFFLDQDSYIDKNSFDEFIKDYKMLGKDEKILSCYKDKRFHYNQTNQFLEVNEVISSGSLIPISLFNSLGLFRDDFFIDFVDYEWCWRARNMGVKIYVDSSDKITFVHQIEGNKKLNGHSVDSLFRLYYIYRNFTIIFLNYKLPKYRKLYFFSRLSGKLLFQFKLDLRKERLCICFKGIKDGVKRWLKKI